MRNPKRILEKILGNRKDLDRLEETSESLEELIELLRDLVRCRRTRRWISDNYGIDIIVSSATFNRLLEIPQINFIENSNRLLEVDTVSLKETRNLNDGVTVGNINMILRELYRNLESIQSRRENEYPSLLLIDEMRTELIDLVVKQINSMKKLNGRLTGYMLNLSKVSLIERNFEKLFPSSIKIGSFRKILPIVEKEIEFYRKCSEMNSRWEALGIDIFKIIRDGGLTNLRENIQELGNLLWKIVYNQRKLEQCLKILGIDFKDTRGMFDANSLNLNNI
ncbi:MAG: hypothetical protein HN646_10435 [Nitrospina sp.]|nr:hypothetical protein [Nitrospina sp.]MBT4129065.1 hypothetical protein [Nitrospina sp.]MBT5969495.1 hypothetical protein [Nitrospina sp.]MBT7522675.1 hypothetical protein [Nitrospina sp.]